MLESIKKHKGEVSIITVAITAGATILASVLGGWATANERVSAEMNEINSKISVVEERENNHYTDLQKQIDKNNDSVNKKLDQLIDLHLKNK